MSIVIIIAVAALMLICVLAVVGLLVLGAALLTWMSTPSTDGVLDVDEQPQSATDFGSAVVEDPATEVFNRGRMFAVFDSDDMDATEVVRMEGGILLDGRTDPALVRTHSPSDKADKD